MVSFAVSRDSKRLVYAAQVANPPMKAGAHSIVVGNQSFWSVMFGQQYLGSQTRMYRFYVQDVGAGQRSRPLGDAFFEGNSAIPVVSISPDGQWAVLPKYERERTLAWSRQYLGLAERVKQSGPAVHRDLRQIGEEQLGHLRAAATAVQTGGDGGVSRWHPCPLDAERAHDLAAGERRLVQVLAEG